MKTRLSAILLNFPICICLYGLPIFAQTGVSLAGSITDEGNKPIAGALVTANRQTVPAASGRATSAADGTLQIGGLPFGFYTVCAQVPGGGFVDDRQCRRRHFPWR